MSPQRIQRKRNTSGGIRRERGTFVYLQQGGKVSHQIQPLDGDVTTDPAVAADAALTREAA